MSNNQVVWARAIGEGNVEAIKAGDEARRRLGIYGLPNDPFKWWARVRAGVALRDGQTYEQSIDTVIYEYWRREVTGIHRSENA